MIYQPIEKLLPRSGFSSYKLIAMAFKRSQELALGSPKLIDAPAVEKVTTTAFREIIAGKLMLKEVADAAELVEEQDKKAKKRK